MGLSHSQNGRCCNAFSFSWETDTRRSEYVSPETISDDSPKKSDDELSVVAAVAVDPVPSYPFLEVEAFFDHKSDCVSCNKTRDTFQLIYRSAKSQLLKQLCTSKGKLALSRQIKKLRQKEDWNGNEATIARDASKVVLRRIFDRLVQKHKLLVTSNNLLLCKSCSSDHQPSVPEKEVIVSTVSEDGSCSDDSNVSMQVLRAP